MQDSSKYLVIAVAVIALVVLFCTKRRGEMMTPASAVPDMQMVKPHDPSAGGLMPADHDTTDYGPYPSSSKPCATAAPFA